MSHDITGQKQPPLSRGRAIGFRVAAILLPFLFLGLLEGTFRLLDPDPVVRDPLINVSPFTVFERIPRPGGETFRIAHPLTYSRSNREFPVAKPAGGLRILCVGGSACAGWPHPPDQTFSAYLEKALQAAYPGRSVEVINAGTHGFASYRVRSVLAEVLPLQPDAVLIWCGNNEFLENRRYARWSVYADRLGLNHLRLVQRLHAARQKPETALPANELKDAALFFWSKVKQQACALRADPAQFAAVKEHYEESIADMVRMADRQGVPVLLCTVPVNLRDWQPTVSRHGVQGAALREWQAAYDAGQRAQLTGLGDATLASFERAVARDPEHAETHFGYARALEATGRIAAARASYSQARDLDYNPFRALSCFNLAIRRIAAGSPAVTLIDLEAAFDRASDRGSAGFDLFLDYVHPNRRGNEVVATTVFKALVNDPAFPAPPFATNDYDDACDVKLQATMLQIDAVNHQYQAALDKARHLVFLRTGRTVNADAATLPPNTPEAEAAIYAAFFAYETARRRAWLDPAANPAELAAAREGLRAFYDQWFPYGKY